MKVKTNLIINASSWTIAIYHRRIHKSKLFCLAPRHRTATKHRSRAAVAGPNLGIKNKEKTASNKC